MNWIPTAQASPKTYIRVWVQTDAGQQTTAYLKSDGTWYINCPKIRATGATVVSWRE